MKTVVISEELHRTIVHMLKLRANEYAATAKEAGTQSSVNTADRAHLDYLQFANGVKQIKHSLTIPYLSVRQAD